MKSLQTYIKEKIFKTAIVPVLLVEILLIAVLFALGIFTALNNKKIMEQSANASFIELSEQLSARINAKFLIFENEANALSKIITTIFEDKHKPTQSLAYHFDQGFYIRSKTTLASVYTTNVKTLTEMDRQYLDCLSLSEVPLDAIISQYSSVIDSAWINMGSKYSLYYPPIRVQDELSPTLDPTKQSYYYEANATYNPSKKAKFIPLFNEPWAMNIGQIAAVVAPIYYNDAMQGVVGMTLTTENIREIGMLAMPFEAYVIISDNEGHVLYSSNDKKLEEDFGVSSFYALHNQDRNQPLMPISLRDKSSDEYLFFEKALDKTSLQLTLVAKKSLINHELNALYEKMRYIAIAIFVFILFFHFFFIRHIGNKTKSLTRKISEPISEIAQLSTRLSDEQSLRFKESDISELALLNSNLDKAHETLITQLYVDSDTKLKNRKKMLQDINDESSIVLIQLENFKTINSIYGPQIAIKLLQKVAQSIEANCIFNSQELYRVYNDVFAMRLIKTSVIDKEKLFTFYTNLSSESIVIEDIEIVVSYAISYSEWVHVEKLTIFSQAELALEDAKSRNIKCVVFDEEKHSAKVFEENLTWAQRLQSAINEDRLVPYFQPIYDIKKRGVHKFESLVRMVEGDEVIAPFYFLATAAKLGKLSEITDIMITKVFKIAQFFPYVEFSINVSFEDFEDVELLEKIESLLKKYSIKPSNIIFEILETATFSNELRATEVIQKLKELGFKIAIDDFGTGNSNFAHLMMMNVDFIKIDGAFIKDILSNEQSYKITKTINQFAKNSAAKSVAEFVKDEKIFRRVQLLDIDFAQGYFISEPRNAESIAEMLKIKI